MVLTFPDLPLWAYPVLFAVGLIAGTVDAIAGGGGLLTLPALLSFGFPAPLALGTAKFQGCFGSGSAAWSSLGKARSTRANAGSDLASPQSAHWAARGWCGPFTPISSAP